MRGEARRHRTLDFLHLGVGVGAGESAEDGGDAGEQAAGALKGDDGVVEVGGRGILRDGGNLGEVLGHAGFIGG